MSKTSKAQFNTGTKAPKYYIGAKNGCLGPQGELAAPPYIISFFSGLIKNSQSLHGARSNLMFLRGFPGSFDCYRKYLESLRNTTSTDRSDLITDMTVGECVLIGQEGYMIFRLIEAQRGRLDVITTYSLLLNRVRSEPNPHQARPLNELPLSLRRWMSEGQSV